MNFLSTSEALQRMVNSGLSGRLFAEPRPSCEGFGVAFGAIRTGLARAFWPDCTAPPHSVDAGTLSVSS